jgi:hypothetical protein
LKSAHELRPAFGSAPRVPIEPLAKLRPTFTGTIF